MPAIDSEHTQTPAEQYLRALWRGRWLFLAIVGAFVVVAVLVTAVLPKSYSSEAIVSVRLKPRLDPTVTQYAQPDPLYPNAIATAIPVTSTIAEDEIGARRFARRLEATTVVAAAARDAGLIGATEGLDPRQVEKWLSVKQIEQIDLVLIAVQQPTAERARRFASALVARGIEASVAEALPDPGTRHLLDQDLQRATSAMAEAEAAVLEASGARSRSGENLFLDRAKLELSLAREQYAAVRRRLAIFDLAAGYQRFQVTIVDPPTLPLTPSFPRPLLNVSIGLILGILAATNFIILRSVLRGT